MPVPQCASPQMALPTEGQLNVLLQLTPIGKGITSAALYQHDSDASKKVLQRPNKRYTEEALAPGTLTEQPQQLNIPWVFKGF